MFGNKPTLWKKFKLSPSSKITLEVEINLDVDMAKAAIEEMLKSEKAKEMLESPYWPPELICDGLAAFAEEEAKKYIRINIRFK